VVGTPIRPLPEDITRWGRRARWLRRLDALAGWLVAWALIVVAWGDLEAGPTAVAAAVAVGALGALGPIRLRWRPVSGAVGLWVSRGLAPGDRAWYVRPDAPELVIVTATRGLRLTVAATGGGAIEGLSVRRTRVLLLTAEPTHR
jgi:hypothetical protein